MLTVQHIDGTPDGRYSVKIEFCGDISSPPGRRNPGQAWVVRFCGDWVGKSPTELSGWRLAREHAEARRTLARV